MVIKHFWRDGNKTLDANYLIRGRIDNALNANYFPEKCIKSLRTLITPS